MRHVRFGNYYLMGDSQPPNRAEFVSRVGTFFLLLGIGLMVFFFLSDAANAANLSYFCWGTILLTIGFMFQAQYKKPAGQPSGRFSVIGRVRNALKPKPKEAKKEEKKK